MPTVAATLAALLIGGVAGLAAAQDAPPPPPPPTPPQEPQTPPRSQALEDLLKRLSEERGAPSLVPPSAQEPAAPAGERPAVPTAERALLTRASDSVQVVLADGRRRDLQYWDARLELGPGDEVRQGPRACVVVDFPDGAHYRLDGGAVWRLLTPASEIPRRLAFAELRRTGDFHLGRAGIDTVIALPGGNEVAGRDARITIRDHDLRALEIRNTGPEPVVARSPYLGTRILTLAAGQRVFLPVLPEPSAFVAHLAHDASVFDESRGKLVVQAPAELALAPAADAIEIFGRGPVGGIARACGARMVVGPGETLRLTRAPLGFPRTREWEE